MGAVFSALLAGFATLFRSHLALQLEILALRHQLAIDQRTIKRPRIHPGDRMFWSWLSRGWAKWREALVFVQPATVISWHRKRFRDHWARMSRAGKPGRPPIDKEIRELIRKVSGANPLWGTPRIIGELRKLGTGIITNPAEAWMLQIARNACDVDDGVLSEGRKLLIDRDAKYSGDWRAFLKEQGVEVIRLPPKSPNLNAYAERFVRSIKEECLNRMIFIGEASMRRALCEFMAHYHAERNHQGLGNWLIRAEQPSVPTCGPVDRRIRLGGMLSFYHYAPV